MKKLVIRQIPISQQEILDLIADATEQETERRKGTGYSGKKKKQTVKTQIIVDTKGHIKHVSPSIPGNIHDKKLYGNTGVKADSGVWAIWKPLCDCLLNLQNYTSSP